MAIEPVNIARFVLGNPKNGIISADGYNAQYSGKNMEEFLSLSAIPGRHGATDVSKLFYEKNSQAIILRPDLELASMVEDSGYTTSDGSPAAKWGIKTIPGQPSLDLIHQYNVASQNWGIQTDADFEQNQGFILYWQKWVTQKDVPSGLAISLGGLTGGFNFILNPGENRIQYFPSTGEVVEEQDIAIPESFYSTENLRNSINVLICLIVDRYIIFGFGGLDNTIAIKCKNYGIAEDVNNKGYPIITPEGVALKIEGNGAALIGFKKLTYEVSGSLATPIGYPGYVVTGSLNADITKAIIPTGCSIEGSGHAGGNNEEEEDVSIGGSGREAIEKFGIYGIVSLIGDGQEATDEQEAIPSNVTPYLYQFRIFSPPERISQDTTAKVLTTDIKTYEENMSGDKDGDFSGSSISASVVCKIQDNQLTHTNIFRSKAPEVRHYLKLRGQESEVLRGVHKLTVKEIGRPLWNKFDLNIESQDITKRLREDPILVSENYDEKIVKKKWTHVDLMVELGRKAGINIRCAAITEDTTVPASYHYLQPSGDTENPNWQFNRGVFYWDAMQRVREFSGWLLYPDNDPSNLGGFYYCPKPTDDSSVKYSFNADNDIVSGVKYRSIDLYRTRFMILGEAAKNSSELEGGDYSNKSWQYKKGQVICGQALFPDLAAEIGESRPLIWVDPAFTDWKSIGIAILRLCNYYTEEHFAPVFQINNFEDYQDLYLYDLIKWVDDTKESHAGAPSKLVDDKFLITSLSVSVDKFTATANINTTVTEQAMFRGILKEARRQREVGMKNYNEMVKGMEAVTKGDYAKLMTQAPGALRIFAYNDWRERAGL